DAARERLNRAFAVCRALRQPDGFSTVISDGYPLDMKVFLATLPSGVPVSSELLLPDAGLALYSRDGDFILFDCSALRHKLAHFHGGKQAPTLFLGGQPFLVDSGCCSYDDDEFSEYYKQPVAHSTLLIDGHGDSVLQGRYTWHEAPTCRLTPWRNGAVESVLTSNAPGWTKVSWRRRIAILPAGVEIFDAVQAQYKAELTFLFNLHPDVRVEVFGCRVLLNNHSVTVSAEFPVVPELREGLGFVNFRKTPCQCLLLRMCGAEVSCKTVFKREK
ncbi:MAG: heparinase II/III-family protein, partial [Lentisphaeria bacterium]